MRVRELMTANPLSVREDDPITRAARLMLENRYGGLPVVDGEGRLVGVLEVDDLLPHPETIPHSDVEALKLFEDWIDPGDYAEIFRRYENTPVAAVMRPDPPVLRPDDRLWHALKTLVENQFRRVPVVDEAARVVGILTRSDFLRLFLAHDEGGR